MTREIDFRYRVLRKGVSYGELRTQPDGSAITLRMDETAEIKTSLSGTFLPDVMDTDGHVIDSDWFADEIQPVMIIDGIEYALGVFAPTTVTPQEYNGVQTLRIEAYDRCWKVRDTYSTTRLSFASGTEYLTVIETLLIEAGVELVLSTPNDATLTETREDWEIGTSYLEIINKLLGEINYNPLWFNTSGAAIVEPKSVPDVENIEHTLDASDVHSLILPQISKESDVYNAPNVFLCVCSNPDKDGSMTATAENTNPQSPLSINRRGRRIIQVTQLDNIASQEELQAYADNLRNESLIGSETIRVSTGLLPGFGVSDVVALHYGEISALCIESAWSMDLRVGGTMQHSLKKVVYNLG